MYVLFELSSVTATPSQASASDSTAFESFLPIGRGTVFGGSLDVFGVIYLKNVYIDVYGVVRMHSVLQCSQSVLNGVK